MARSFEVGVIGITVRAGQKSANAVFAFFPTPDFLYIVRVVLSLVALLFGFDQVSREKEGGTLRLLLANPASRGARPGGQMAGQFRQPGRPLPADQLIGIAAISLDPAVRFSADQAGRLGPHRWPCPLVYIAFFLSLGMLVSALTRRASTSLVILLFAWALLVFVLPNLGTLAARQFVDVPSVRALSEKREQVWTREVLLGIRGEKDWAARGKTISAENDALEADYRVKFDRLVALAQEHQPHLAGRPASSTPRRRSPARASARRAPSNGRSSATRTASSTGRSPSPTRGRRIRPPSDTPTGRSATSWPRERSSTSPGSPRAASCSSP